MLHQQDKIGRKKEWLYLKQYAAFKKKLMWSSVMPIMPCLSVPQNDENLFWKELISSA